jgi:hypothetical protein
VNAPTPNPATKRQLICVDCEVAWQAAGDQHCWVCGSLGGVAMTAAGQTSAMLFGHLPDLRWRLNRQRVSP